LQSLSSSTIAPIYVLSRYQATTILSDIDSVGIMTAMVAPDRELDITNELCPMTFVRTRLALDRMQPGETLLVRLRGEEPLRNVPRTAREQGHEVLSLEAGPDGISLLLLRRG
jgi:tRNA 2-thiouridine synthesizing protein A